MKVIVHNLNVFYFQIFIRRKSNLNAKLQGIFFATSHGKEAVDGIGGNAKRSVWRAVKTGTNHISDASEYRISSNKRSPLISATLSGVIEINAYPLIIAALLNAALIRIVTIFYQ